MECMPTAGTVLAFALVAAFALLSPASSAPADCSTVVSSLFDCLAYVTNGSTVSAPSSGCCGGVGVVATNSPQCICSALQQATQLGIAINTTRILGLTAVCNVKAPVVYCNATPAPSVSPSLPPKSSSPAPSVSPSPPPKSSSPAPSVSPSPPPKPSSPSPSVSPSPSLPPKSPSPPPSVKPSPPPKSSTTPPSTSPPPPPQSRAPPMPSTEPSPSPVQAISPGPAVPAQSSLADASTACLLLAAAAALAAVVIIN